jgi:hypothetical protein
MRFIPVRRESERRRLMLGGSGEPIGLSSGVRRFVPQRPTTYVRSRIPRAPSLVRARSVGDRQRGLRWSNALRRRSVRTEGYIGSSIAFQSKSTGAVPLTSVTNTLRVCTPLLPA